MKKTILIWAVVLMTGINFSFANKTDGINDNATASFKKDFANAKEASWENGKLFIRVTFKINEQVATAYYSKEGELFAVTRNILSSQLPINQLMGLNRNYQAYWISDLFELNSTDETAYYVTLENADTKMVLKSTHDGNWQVYKKTSK